MLKRIEELSLLRGVSGDEEMVAEYITRQIDGFCQWRIDRLGSVIAFKEGRQRPRQKLLFAAHMDEVGFLITGHSDEGLLRFDTVGGIDSRVIIGKPVLVGPQALPGIIGAKAVHMMNDQEKDTPLKPSQLYIDIGLRDRERAEKAVRVGDRAVFDSDFVPFGQGFLKGRALDDRAGCALLIEMIRSELEYDAWFLFETQEETGGAGARAAAQAIQPDCAIVVEATTAADLSGVAQGKQVCRLGQGPVLSFMDRGTLYDKGLYRLALELAQEHKLPAQSKLGVFGGNDSRAIQTAGAGVRCLAVSLPCRYLHSPCCVLKADDVHNTLKLLQLLAPRVAALD